MITSLKDPSTRSSRHHLAHSIRTLTWFLHFLILHQHSLLQQSINEKYPVSHQVRTPHPPPSCAPVVSPTPRPHLCGILLPYIKPCHRNGLSRRLTVRMSLKSHPLLHRPCRVN
ncbi:hypothetical protein M438DRAFT_90718 [Aureobasidium pullulans EXF-150]|uniref:Uncharacterized protein n=1 Tax=Aureobasidium pullulans EXF-150 TaxID=1043002 RepID=A0A074Y3F4_AURPU|nr:uncharacterized protein M438DRAFT_90718 [Aureobasidium pullulans EXF-150]KEQ88707.1 hypothetical protein M438DRAFT_90718 [Aureobasidium pullulans EXF-150]